jgi:uncharacterized HAD superfamily protein
MLPRRTPIPLVVTARLEKHRDATEAWLAEHGIQVSKLVMGSWDSAEERTRYYSAAHHKGLAYADSDCLLFIESSDMQAREIHQASGRPVLAVSSKRVYQR